MKQFFYNLYSRRNKEKSINDKSSIYAIPKEVRNKIIWIVKDNVEKVAVIGHDIVMDKINELYDLRAKFAKEIGRETLSNEKDPEEDIKKFILTSSEKELLAFIEFLLAFKFDLCLKHYRYNDKFCKNLKMIYEDINRVFKGHDIPFEIVRFDLEEGLPFIVVPYDSKYLHKETIKKTVKLLINENFKGPLEEFERAIERFKTGDFSTAIVYANNSFESTLKSIMDKLGIIYGPRDTAIPLVNKLFNSNIVDKSLKDSFTKAVQVLQTGLPTLRNKPGSAHGSGLEPQKFSKAYAEFALNLAGTYIVFLINLFTEIKNRDTSSQHKF